MHCHWIMCFMWYVLFFLFFQFPVLVLWSNWVTRCPLNPLCLHPRIESKLPLQCEHCYRITPLHVTWSSLCFYCFQILKSFTDMFAITTFECISQWSTGVLLCLLKWSCYNWMPNKLQRFYVISKDCPWIFIAKEWTTAYMAHSATQWPSPVLFPRIHLQMKITECHVIAVSCNIAVCVFMDVSVAYKVGKANLIGWLNRISWYIILHCYCTG